MSSVVRLTVLVAQSIYCKKRSFFFETEKKKERSFTIVVDGKLARGVGLGDL
jgi:hypothetical protein